MEMQTQPVSPHLPAAIGSVYSDSLPADAGISEGIAAHGAATSGALSHRSYIPSAAFRARLAQLADEYENMQTALVGLLSADSGAETSGRGMHAQGDAPHVNVLSSPSASTTQGTDAAPVVATRSVSDAIGKSLRQTKHFGKPVTHTMKGKRTKLFRKQSTLVDLSCDAIRSLVHSSAFDRTVGVVILTDAVCLGVTLNSEMTDVLAGERDISQARYRAVQAAFLAVYVVELLARLIGYGRAFFFDKHTGASNIFDLVLVLQGLLDQVLLDFGAFSFLRVLRVLKMGKMFRVIRTMRSMRDLRLILYSVLGCARTMLASLFLVLICQYMFALMFVQGMLSYVTTTGDIDAHREDIVMYWGSVAATMELLFKSSTGGMDWGDATTSLSLAGKFFVFMFYLYVSFFLFVIMNAITSIFVEATMNNANRDMYHTIHSELEKKEMYMESLRVLFNEMDDSGDGVLSIDEFMSNVENPIMIAFFSSVGIEIEDATRVFSTLSEGGVKKVTLEEFYAGCIRLRGQARSADLREHMTKMQREFHETKRCIQNIEMDRMMESRNREAEHQLGTHAETAQPIAGSCWRERATAGPGASTPSTSALQTPPATEADHGEPADWNPDLWAAS